jgi:protein-ribulosamine 3-kinase
MSEGAIRSGLAALLDVALQSPPGKRVAGGDINQCFRYETERGPIFVKVANADALDMFEAEAAGLKELHFADVVRLPEVLGVGRAGEHALLILEWLDLERATPKSDQVFGERLARLHATSRDNFGWERDNFIGTIPQSNKWSDDWVHFWRTHRLGAQLNLAARNGADTRFMERATLLSVLMDGFFATYRPTPSLLHGDLWNGNYAADADGKPVLFDPAVYYGDRECDVAMTKLFGGFDRAFYAAYEEAWPLDSGATARVDLYNLYHVLNHHNLFGGVYLAQASRMIDKLLAELGH